MQRRNFLKTAAASGIGVGEGVYALAEQYGNESMRPIIDTHMHIWADDPKKYPFPHPYDPNYKSPQHDATVEMLLDDMDTEGCTHAVLVQVIFHGWDNSYIADCWKRDPERFRAHGLIDPTDPNVADRLEYWTKEHGLHGMRFSPIYYQDGRNGGDGWIDAPETHRLWKMAEMLGSILNFLIVPKQLPKLQTMVQAHPDVRVVVDHLGRVAMNATDTDQELQRLLDLAKYPNVWVKVSELDSVSQSKQYPFDDSYPYVRRVYEAFGPDRLLFGTGYPGAARAAFHRPKLREEIDIIDKRIGFFTAEDRDKILGGNAAKLWGFEV